MPFDLDGQIAGHVPGQRVLPHEQPDAGGVPGQEQGGLAGRVASAHDDDRVPLAHLGFEHGRRVVDARGLEPFQIPHVEPPVADAGRDDQGARVDRAALPHGDDVIARVQVQSACLCGDAETRAELVGLDRRPLRQFAAGDPGREAEVVLDP